MWKHLKLEDPESEPFRMLCQEQLHDFCVVCRTAVAIMKYRKLRLVEMTAGMRLRKLTP
jgi:hypothetical protein